MSKLCTLCPRNCSADRAKGEGFCASPSLPTVTRASLHMWEEPCITLERGSGTVFFAGCQLRCVFCQNSVISKSGEVGITMDGKDLAKLFLIQQERGAHNINLVTPSHYVNTVAEAIDISKAEGLSIPVVWNSSAYEKAETLKLLKDRVDIWLPDYKYASSYLAKRYSKAEDYPVAARQAIDEMVSQQPECVFAEDGALLKGVIVRILLLPGAVDDAKERVKYIFDRYGEKVYFSLMSQYTPHGDLSSYPELCRTVTGEEYDELIDFAVDLGITQGFTQELGAAEESFIPSFQCEGLEDFLGK